MGIYCVERVLLVDVPELARATSPKAQVFNIKNIACFLPVQIYGDNNEVYTCNKYRRNTSV